MMIKFIVTIFFVVTIVAGRQEHFSDDEDVVVRRITQFPEKKTIKELFKMCEENKGKTVYVGGSAKLDGSVRCNNHKSEYGSLDSVHCYWAEVRPPMKYQNKLLTIPKEYENVLLHTCPGPKENNILLNSGLADKPESLNGSVYIIMDSQYLKKSRASRLWNWFRG